MHPGLHRLRSPGDGGGDCRLALAAKLLESNPNQLSGREGSSGSLGRGESTPCSRSGVRSDEPEPEPEPEPDASIERSSSLSSW